MINIPTLPFTEENGIVKLTGPVFLSCGCGQVIARWATVQQNLAHRLPHGKPKASRIIAKWIEQNELTKKFPILKKHQYGIVVAETEDGIEGVDIMPGTTMSTAEKIGDLIRRSNDYSRNNRLDSNTL